MKAIGLIIFIFIDITCFGQITSNVSIRCGSNNQKAQEYFELGNYALRTNRLDKAKSIFIAAVKEDSMFCDAWDNLSICCRRLGHYKDAFTSGLHSLMIDSTNAIAWSNCGYAAYLSNDIYRALTSFDHIQRLIPNDPEGYYGKSLVLYSIDSLSEARENLYKAEKAYKLNKINKGPEVDLLLGFIEYKSGNKKEAQSIFENIYPKFKDNSELNYFLGNCILENENNSKKSQKYIEKAKELGYIIESDSTIKQK